jgi:hypothetical protein
VPGARPSTTVWFCTACDDQAPWTADEAKPCPTCQTLEHVKEATRFKGMEDAGRD